MVYLVWWWFIADISQGEDGVESFLISRLVSSHQLAVHRMLFTERASAPHVSQLSDGGWAKAKPYFTQTPSLHFSYKEP